MEIYTDRYKMKRSKYSTWTSSMLKEEAVGKIKEYREAGFTNLESIKMLEEEYPDLVNEMAYMRLNRAECVIEANKLIDKGDNSNE